MVTAVYTGPWSHGILSAPPRVEAISGLVPQGNFVPSRRFQEEGLEALKQSKRGGGGARGNKYAYWRSRRSETNEAY